MSGELHAISLAIGRLEGEVRAHTAAQEARHRELLDALQRHVEDDEKVEDRLREVEDWKAGKEAERRVHGVIIAVGGGLAGAVLSWVPDLARRFGLI